MAELHAIARGRAARSVLVAAVTALAGWSAGPAAAGEDQLPAGYATRPFTPRDFHMPEGQGCTGDVARWRAVQDNDYASGNVGLKVYGQIQAELDRAAAACAAGRDAEARGLVAASRRRHGYPG